MAQHSFPSRNAQRRREIAALAARMMAEDGIGDFGFAKRKAARRLGVGDSEDLPANAEIETELRLWQTLYQGKEHTERLAGMRRAAVGLMRLLAGFRPYLTGGALDGTAARYAEVEIDLFPESAKKVEIFLLDAGLAFEHREVRKPAPDAPEMALALDWEDIPARLSIYPAGAERGHRQPRARLAQVEALLTIAHN
ncbi:MAG: hypothetical protein LBL48_10070 [Azoarcus sp.]|jgi:hypothetical protein|nr:hypothetical protein [Azoarcus sp.]